MASVTLEPAEHLKVTRTILSCPEPFWFVLPLKGPMHDRTPFVLMQALTTALKSSDFRDKLTAAIQVSVQHAVQPVAVFSLVEGLQAQGLKHSKCSAVCSHVRLSRRAWQCQEGASQRGCRAQGVQGHAGKRVGCCCWWAAQLLHAGDLQMVFIRNEGTVSCSTAELVCRVLASQTAFWTRRCAIAA